MKKELSAGIIIRGSRILLVENRKHGSLRVEPPGGKKMPSESWEGSVEREVMEELGVRVCVGRLFAEYDTFSPEGEFIVRMYLCEMTGGEPRVMEPHKIPAFGWYAYGELLELKDAGHLVPNMVAALDKLKGLLG